MIAVGARPEGIRVVDLMSSPVVLARESDGVFEALQAMSEHGVRRLPVVAEDGTLAGIVTADDVLRVMAAELANLGTALRRGREREATERGRLESSRRRQAMYRRILVAVDGSGTSQLALAQGIELAKEPQARLRLIHVVDETGSEHRAGATPNDFWRAARKAGERVLEEAKARAQKAGVEPETKLLEIRTLGALVRRVASSIVAEAERWEADLIVIGTHGRRGLSKLVLGSTADGVVRTAGRPVLLIPGSGLTTRRARSRRA